MIRLITWCSPNMSRSAGLCVTSALANGADFANQFPLGFNDHDSFQNFNADVLNQKRGAGYWLYKPYLIYCHLLSIPDGDILIYSDAGIEFVNHVNHIINRMDEDIFFFSNGHRHVEWCKGDVLNDICPDIFGLDFDDNHSRQQHIKWALDKFTQVQASVIFFRVNQRTRDFVKEWLLWCQMPGFIDDSPSKLPNYPTFAEHRHDQAILTCLQIKYGYKTHFWPTNYSEHIRHTAQPGDDYPTIFNHHRLRNPGAGDGQPEWK